jgi:hypothetical protein
MNRVFHTVGAFLAACSLALLAQGCRGRAAVEDTVQREIEAITAMKQLSLVEYRVSKIIKADDEGAWYKLGDRKILLSCTAYLKAGIDLATFGPDDVDIDWTGNRVTVTIPHATLLSLDMPASEIREEYDHVTMFRHSFSAEERNALLRQGDAEAAAGEELFAQLVLQGPEGLGQGGLGHVQQLRRPGHILLPRRGKEIAQGSDLHRKSSVLFRFGISRNSL